MKATTSIIFATIGMHTENAYIALGCATVVLILMTREFKKSSL